MLESGEQRTMLASERVKVNAEQTSEIRGDEKLSDHCINCNSILDNTLNKISKISIAPSNCDEDNGVDDRGGRPCSKTEISVPQAVFLLFQFQIKDKEEWSVFSAESIDSDPILPGYYACKRCGVLLEAAYNAVADFKRATKQGSLLSSKFGRKSPATSTLKVGKPAVFKSQTVRKIHTGTGSKSNPVQMLKHKCHICKKSFSTVILLKKHCKLYHAQKKRKLSGGMEELKEEMGGEGGGAKQACPGGGDFPDMTDQNSSKVKGGEDKPVYKCEVCGKLFLRPDHCQLHLRTHTGEKPYPCDTCGKAFSDPRGLSFHEITHSNERPFCCTICGQTFKRRHHLNDHEKNHHREAPRPFKCSLCGKAFKHKKHLNSHVVVHREKKEHQCSICLKAFGRKDNLSQHIRKVHEKPEDSRGKNRKHPKASKSKTPDSSPATTIIVTTAASSSPVVVGSLNLSKPVITPAQLNNSGKQAGEAVTVSIPDSSHPTRDTRVDGGGVNVANTIPVAIAISEEQIVYMHL